MSICRPVPEKFQLKGMGYDDEFQKFFLKYININNLKIKASNYYLIFLYPKHNYI